MPRTSWKMLWNDWICFFEALPKYAHKCKSQLVELVRGKNKLFTLCEVSFLWLSIGLKLHKGTPTFHWLHDEFTLLWLCFAFVADIRCNWFIWISISEHLHSQFLTWADLSSVPLGKGICEFHLTMTHNMFEFNTGNYQHCDLLCVFDSQNGN